MDYEEDPRFLSWAQALHEMYGRDYKPQLSVTCFSYPMRILGHMTGHGLDWIKITDGAGESFIVSRDSGAVVAVKK